MGLEMDDDGRLAVQADNRRSVFDVDDLMIEKQSWGQQTQEGRPMHKGMSNRHSGPSVAGNNTFTTTFSANKASPRQEPISHMSAQPTHQDNVELSPSEVDTEKAARAQQLAMSMWLGLLLDGIPESLVIGFMVNAHKISLIFVIAIFIANFPEAYSASALLDAQKLPRVKIFMMWFLVFMVTGALACLGSLLLPEAQHGDEEAERFEERAAAIMEGITGGSMMAMLGTAMLPEAFHMVGAPSGLLFAAGFVFSYLVDCAFSYWLFEPPKHSPTEAPSPTTAPAPTPASPSWWSQNGLTSMLLFLVGFNIVLACYLLYRAFRPSRKEPEKIFESELVSYPGGRNS